MRDQPAEMSNVLLEWYDKAARSMPWRIPPADRRRGVLPDPYRVWLSEVMLQQTTVATVGAYFREFTTRWPGVADLAAAEDAEVMAAWAGLGYYARARNLLKCARAIAANGGEFPRSEAQLMKLPGIGPYTAAAIAAIAFDHPATVLDGNVERVMARLNAVDMPLPDAKEVLRACAATLTPFARAGDYAQAVMDLGATICTPRNPACDICPWRGSCKARLRGDAGDLPRKRAKPAKPVRQGIAYLARRRDGAILLETRPEKGLLGGMLGLPVSEWSAGAPLCAKPLNAGWQVAPGEVRHTFTHFHLRLVLHIAEVPEDAVPSRGSFHPGKQVAPGALPTVMRKALHHGLVALGDIPSA